MTWNPSGTNAISALFSSASTGNIAVGVGATVSTAPIQAGGLYSAYDLTINAHSNSQGSVSAALTMQCYIQWYLDAAASIPVGPPDTWQFWVGNAAGAVPNCYVSGQVRGNYFVVSFQNPGTTVSAQTVDTLTIFGSNRYQSGLTMYQAAPGNGSIDANFTMFSSEPGAYQPDVAVNLELYNQWAVTVPASSSFWQPLPLYAGPVWSRLDIGTAFNNDMVLCSGENIYNGGLVGGVGARGIIVNYGNTASQEYEQSLIMPQCPCYFTMVTNTSPVSFQYHLVAQRYAGS
jgi:hypothetical protein